jgi:hypothetical protein
LVPLRTSESKVGIPIVRTLFVTSPTNGHSTVWVALPFSEYTRFTGAVSGSMKLKVNSAPVALWMPETRGIVILAGDEADESQPRFSSRG